MGWLFELILEIVGGAAADAAASRLPPWGCALIVAGIAGLVILLIWLGS